MNSSEKRKQVDYVRSLLGGIPVLWADLGLGLVSTTSADSEGGRSGQSTSRVLINAEQVDLDRGSELWSWCMLIIDEQADLDILRLDSAPGSSANVREMCGWLSREADWIVDHHPYFPENVHRLYWKYRHLAGQPPRPTYHCGECGNRIDTRGDGAWFQCSACGRSWTLDQEVSRLVQRAEQVMSLPKIAKTLDIPDRTLRRWAEQGRITPAGRKNGGKVYDLALVSQVAERTRETA